MIGDWFKKVLQPKTTVTKFKLQLVPLTWKDKPMHRVIIESPFAGVTNEDIGRNIKYARDCARDCIAREEVPFASHLFFPQFLDDKDPNQRKLGIEMGFDFWQKADKVVFYTDLGMSPGMKEALAKAFTEGKPFEKRSLSRATQPLQVSGGINAAPGPSAPVNLDDLEKAVKEQA